VGFIQTILETTCLKH